MGKAVQSTYIDQQETQKDYFRRKKNQISKDCSYNLIKKSYPDYQQKKSQNSFIVVEKGLIIFFYVEK